MDYRLSVFRAVAEQASVTKAARVLHLSQPAVTQHIKMLEAEVGQALFARDSRGVTLTKAGAILLKHARQVARLEEAAVQEIRGAGGIVRGSLALGATSTIGQYLLPEWLVESRRRWPGLALAVETSNTEKIIDRVLTGKLDLGLIEGRCRRVGLQAESFLDDELICVSAPAHPLARGGAVTLAALKNQTWIVREHGSGTRDIVELALRKHGLNPARLKIDLELDSSEAIKTVVAGGHGLAFLSRFAVRRELGLGLLRAVPVRGFRVTRKLHAVYPRGPRPTGAAGAFLELVQQVAPAQAREAASAAITPGYDI